MLSFMKASKPIKGYKITDNERTKKYGIGADSLKMLITKAKLKFPIEDCRMYLAKDGYEITDEEYFSTIEPQTLFIVAGPNDVIKSDSDLEEERLKNQQPLLRISDIINEFIEKNPEKFCKMIEEFEKRRQQKTNIKSNGLNSSNIKTLSSLKSDHMEWFQGSDQKNRTKEEVMAKRSQDRIRGYYYKVKDDITHSKLYRSSPKAREIFDNVLQKFRYLLISCDYFPMLFDRTYQTKHTLVEKLKKLDETDAGPMPSKRLRQVLKNYTADTKLLDEYSVSLCSERGDFYCHGPYSSDSNEFPCSEQHQINPYSSRENLVLFQIWNLDHQIELSRTILPALIDNVRKLIESPDQKCELHSKNNLIEISIIEYFLEIFSLKNLKLVHIVCHEKCQRENKSNGRLLCQDCDEYQILRKFDNISCPDDI